MYKITAYFKDQKIIKQFYDVYDAIEFKDTVDAHYPIKVRFEKVNNMKELIYESWNNVMDHKHNPLRHIPDINTRHMVMQILAWMWCIAFSMYFGSMWVFGITAIAHVAILAAIAVTVATFTTAAAKPEVFNLRPGYHSVSRTRQHMWINGKRITLDVNDPGGEHE